MAAILWEPEEASRTNEGPFFFADSEMLTGDECHHFKGLKDKCAC